MGQTKEGRELVFVRERGGWRGGGYVERGANSRGVGGSGGGEGG